MSLQDPISRKRSLPNSALIDNSGVKKMKQEASSSSSTAPQAPSASTLSGDESMFSEQMYSAYVRSALDSLDKVSIFNMELWTRGFDIQYHLHKVSNEIQQVITGY